MGKNDNKQVQEFFLAALELPAEERDAWLVEKCCDDVELLCEIRSLLEHHSPDEDPLENGADEALLSDAGRLQHNDQGLHVRCPHCHYPIELAGDAELDSVTCSSCGSGFSLIAAEQTKSFTPSNDKRIAHFNIVDKVGTGAFGSVYRAFDESLSRTVAIKIPRKGQLTSEEAEKFFREARTAAQLRHPNIVSVHEVGRDEDRIYIVSDFVDGLTLTDWLTGMQPTFQEASQLLIKVAHALHHAHEHGVIHRDLKPGNIMLDRANEPHLMDFGLAKREAGEITMTLDGQVLGTPAYMSPEQARGEGHHVDRQTDVYALGVILFEMLTGERPFRGNTQMLLHQVLTEEAPSPRKLNATVPRDLETICLKCLEKSPDKRYATADEFANELRCFLEHKPISARHIGSIARGWRWCRRKPAVAGLIATIMFLMLVVAIVSPLIALQQSMLRRDARDRAEKARLAAEREQQIGRQLQHNLYVADMNRVQSLWEAGRLNHAIDLLERHLPVHGKEDHRSFEWYHFWQKCHPDILEFELPSEKTVELSFANPIALSPDGTTLAMAGDDHSVRVVDYSTGGELTVLSDHQGIVTCISFSSDGTMLASASEDGTIKLWELRTSKILDSFKGHHGEIYCIKFSPDSKLLASSSREDRSIKVWQVTGGQGRLKCSFDDQPLPHNLDFSPEGSRLAVALLGGSHRIFNLATEKLEHVSSSHEISYGIAYSPDGKYLAVGGMTLSLWDTSTNQLKTSILHTKAVLAVAFSPDGASLLAGGYDGIVRLWSIPNGKLIATYKGHSDWVRSLDIAPDGDTAVSASHDGTVKRWHITDSVPEQHLRPHLGPVFELAFSPIGLRLASVSPRGTAKMWNVVTGELLWTIKANGRGVAFSPDAAFIATVPTRGSGCQLWSSDNGKLIASFRAEGEVSELRKDVTRLRNVVFSPDGKTIVTPSGYDNSIELWDVASKTLTGRLLGHSGWVEWVAFSPDGETLASAGDDSQIIIWDVARQSRKRTLSGHLGQVWCVVFSHDGEMLASAGRDHTVRVWDPTTGESLKTLRGHSDQVNSVVFFPDDKTLASGSVDYQIKLWDLALGDEKTTLNAHTGVIRSISVSADGKNLASAGYDQTIRLWRADSYVEGKSRYRPAEQQLVDPGGDGWARKLQWKNALDSEMKSTGDQVTWKQVALLYAAGQEDEYRAALQILLENYEQLDQPYQHHLYLQFSLLSAVDESLFPAIRWLAERNATAEEPWRRELVGQAMYRLGEYRQWYDSLSDDSPLQGNQDLILRIVSFQKDPSSENRNRLQSKIEQEENSRQATLKNGVIQGYWHSYVKRSAWIAEAKKVLNAAELPQSEESSQ